MAAAEPLLDRVSGRRVPAITGRALSGQYVRPPAHPAGGPGDPPARGGEYHLTAREDAREGESDQVTVEAALVIGRTVAALAGRRAPLAELVDVSPLVDGAAAKRALGRQPLEEAVEEHLRFLRAVCFRPVSRLRPVNHLVPVPRARRITPQTVTRLAAHSEDWASLRPDGVRPERVLSPEHEVDLDLYENRVAAHLVDQLLRYLTVRVHQIRTIRGMFGDIGRYVEDVSSRTWQQGSHRLWELLAELVEQEDWDARAERRLRELEKLRGAVSALRGSPLWNGVDRRAELGTSLRTTNLLAGDERYRHVAVLWRSWMATTTRSTPVRDRRRRSREWYRGFESYAAVLLLRALDEVGGHATPAEQPALARGAGPVLYRHGKSELTLRWGVDGVLVIERAGAVVLRVVPLPHPLTASRLGESASAELAALDARQPTGPTLVLYPGSVEERRELPLAVRLRAFEAPGAPAPGTSAPGTSAPTTSAPGVPAPRSSASGAAAPGEDAFPVWRIPVSPLEIDSVTRVARGLRFVLEEPRLTGYPYPVPAGAGVDTAFLSAIPWLSTGDTGITVTRVPVAHERAKARATVLGRRQDTSRFLQRGTNAEALNQLWEGVEHAVEQTVGLTRCPRCGAESAAPERTLQTGADGYFRCSCDQCGAVWEGRRCQACPRTYPVLEPSAAVQAGNLDGDRLDRQFATDLLAAPCWSRPRVFICPWCAVCGNADATCARCTLTGAT